MVSAILYASETGSCKKYAEMLSAALHVPAKPVKGATVRKDGNVIYIGWLMNGTVQGLKQAMKKYHVTAVVQVGMAPVNERSAVAGRKKNAVSEDIAYFCRQGAFNMEKLPAVYQLIMKIVNKKTIKLLQGKADMTPQEKAVYVMASTGKGEPAEWKIDDIVEWAHGEGNRQANRAMR